MKLIVDSIFIGGGINSNQRSSITLPVNSIDDSNKLISNISFWFYLDQIPYNQSSFTIISRPQLFTGLYLDRLQRLHFDRESASNDQYFIKDYPESIESLKVIPLRQWVYISLRSSFLTKLDNTIESTIDDEQFNLTQEIWLDNKLYNTKTTIINNSSNIDILKKKYSLSPLIIGDQSDSSNSSSICFLIQRLTIGDDLELDSDNKEHLTPPTYPRPSSTIPVSKPIGSLIQLLDWKPPLSGSSLNQLFHDPLVSSVPLRPIPERKQQIIHCHDMMGGYLPNEIDPYPLSLKNQTYNQYSFQFWQLIDIFIYFTHQRISIPPVGWIETAHKNGVKVMGTIIMEWEGGVPDACLLVNDKFSSLFIDKLIQVAKYYGFDGWFINIESNLPSSEVADSYKTFLKDFTDRMHSELPGSLVIWYDSVLNTGELKWQNMLNEKNNQFFQQCDGIFLNYRWNIDMLKDSAKLAGDDKKHNVYVGTDVWGRGTYGDGKLKSYIGIKEASSLGLSSALFAPGWTFEDNKSSTRIYYSKELQLWVNNSLKNLISNGSGENDLNSWIITEKGGDDWGISQSGGLNGGKAFVSSYQWSTMNQLVDLTNGSECKFNEELLDLSPIIEFEFYCCGSGPKYNDLLQYKIEIKDKEKNSIYTYSSDTIECTKEYKKYQLLIPEYPKGARYISVDFRGKDIENWAGRFGSQVTGIYLHLWAQKSVESSTAESIVAYSGERVSTTVLPFQTYVNRGRGLKYYRKGEVVSNREWFDLSSQDITGCLEYGEKCGSPLVETVITDEDSCFGGSSLLLRGKLLAYEQNSILATIYKVDIPIVPSSKVNQQQDELAQQLEIIYYWKDNSTGSSKNGQNILSLVLEFEDKFTVVLSNGSLDIAKILNALKEKDVVVLETKEQSKLLSNGWIQESVPLRVPTTKRLIAIKLLSINSLDSVSQMINYSFGGICLRYNSATNDKQHSIIQNIAKLHTNEETSGIWFEKLWNSASLTNGREINDWIIHWSSISSSVGQDYHHCHLFVNGEWVGRSEHESYLLRQLEVGETYDIRLELCSAIDDVLHVLTESIVVS